MTPRQRIRGHLPGKPLTLGLAQPSHLFHICIHPLDSILYFCTICTFARLHLINTFVSALILGLTLRSKYATRLLITSLKLLYAGTECTLYANNDMHRISTFFPSHNKQAEEFNNNIWLCMSTHQSSVPDSKLLKKGLKNVSVIEVALLQGCGRS